MNGKKNSGALKVFLIILAVILLAVILIFVWQRKNIFALYKGMNKTDTDIQQQIDDSKKTVEDELEQYNIEGLRDFTFEEEEAIRRGQITVEEAIEKIINESNIKSEQIQQNSNTQSQGDKSDATAIIGEYTIKLYSLKAQYLGQIGNLIDQAKADYKNGAGAKALMSKYLSKAGSLEGEADSKVNSLLSELKAKLENVGADTGIVETMRNSYENEKSLKKSYYLSLFNKKK